MSLQVLKIKNQLKSQHLIPLGRNTWKGRSKSPYIFLNYNDFGAIACISMSGHGKSVLLKRIYQYPLRFFNRKRTGIIFDLQSEDHHLSRFSNTNSSPLFWSMGESPVGIDNLRCYSPVFCEEEMHPFDHRFGFSLTDLELRDFHSLNMNPSTLREFMTIIKRNPKIASDPAKLLDQIVDYPTNSMEFKKAKNLGIDAEYPINFNIKNSILSMLQAAVTNNLFIKQEDTKTRVDFLQKIREGEVICINFHQTREYAPLYSGVILRQLYLDVRRKARMGFNFRPPIVIVEEADLMLPEHDVNMMLGSNKWLMEILRRGRKYGFYTILATQSASSLNPNVKDHIQTWLIGSVTGRDYAFFNQIFSQEIMRAIESLEHKKNEWGAKEWLIAYNNKDYDTFVPFNSALQIHRVGGSGHNINTIGY